MIFVRKGHYRGAIFKFCLMIPLSYPDEGPKVHFLSEVFHPLIHPDTGLLDISLQFPTWSSNQHYIVLLLCYIKKIFYKTDMWEMQTQGKTGGGATSVKEAMNPKAQNLSEQPARRAATRGLESSTPSRTLLTFFSLCVCSVCLFPPLFAAQLVEAQRRVPEALRAQRPEIPERREALRCERRREAIDRVLQTETGA